MATVNNRRTLITKRILREALLELMQTAPITKITIKQICELSEMSRSTFYLHYQDQYELLKDIENDVLKKTFENFDIKHLKSDMIGAITAFLEYIKANKNTFGVLLCNDENKSFQQAIMLKVQKHIRSLIHPNYEEDKESILYSFIMNGSLNVISDWIKSDFEMPTRELAETIYFACNSIIKGVIGDGSD